MKTASMVLGIVGGALAVIGGLVLIFFSTSMFSAFSSFDYGDTYSSGIMTNMFDSIKTAYVIWGIVAGIGGILGIIGGAIVRNNNITGGILMIIATVLGFSIPLLLGAIFAFIRDKQPAPPYAPYAPYPYPPQGPYMNQPPYPPYPLQPPVYPNQYPQQPPQYQPPQNPTDEKK